MPFLLDLQGLMERGAMSLQVEGEQAAALEAGAMQLLNASPPWRRRRILQLVLACLLVLVLLNSLFSFTEPLTDPHIST